MKTKTAKSRPTYLAFVVESNGRDSKWTEIGAAWMHEDSKGFNLTLKTLPVGGKVVLRERPADREGGT